MRIKFQTIDDGAHFVMNLKLRFPFSSFLTKNVLYVTSRLLTNKRERPRPRCLHPPRRLMID